MRWITYIDGSVHTPTHDGVVLVFPIASLTTFHLIGGFIIEYPCLVGKRSHTRRFVMIWTNCIDGALTYLGTHVASHHLYHYFIARKGPSPFLRCLLAYCTWIEELIGGLTLHFEGFNYLHMI
jgi:hypothetical protein